MKKIKDLGDLSQKIVLLRVDLNVPLQNNKVLDATRIKKVINNIKAFIGNRRYNIASWFYANCDLSN